MLRRIMTLVCLASMALVARAQQNQEREYVQIPYAYPAYKEATLTMLFGSKKKVMANIYYDGSKLYYLQDSVAMEANVGNIVRVEFDDALYLTVDTLMARVVAEKNGKRLLCVKCIDVDEMVGRADGKHDRKGEGLPFFHLEGYGLIDMAGTANGDPWQFPLMRTYYFQFPDGSLVPASEKLLKKRYTGERRKQFIDIVENRLWSWKDEQSLAELLEFL